MHDAALPHANEAIEPGADAAPSSCALRLEDHDRTDVQCLQDFELEAPVIVLWEHADAEIDVRQSRSRAWRFRPRDGSLDLYAAGGYAHYVNTAGVRRKLVAHFPVGWTLDSPPGGGHSGPLQVHTRMQYQDRLLERLLRQLRSHVQAGEPMGAMFSELLSIAVVQQIATGTRSPDHAAPAGTLKPRVQRLLGEFIEHRLDEPPAIEHLAAISCLGISNFLKAFRTSFGMTPHQYVLHRRVERAKRFLLDEAESLSDLAARLGFASHAHFTTIFHARTGTTPSEYRRLHSAKVFSTTHQQWQTSRRTVPGCGNRRLKASHF